MNEMGNWSELHSERSNLLQNPYFREVIESKKSKTLHADEKQQQNMLFAAWRRGAFLIMPRPQTFQLHKVVYQSFFLRYHLFLYYQWSNASFRILKKTGGNMFL
jgi:hypothetical protein